MRRSLLLPLAALLVLAAGQEEEETPPTPPPTAYPGEEPKAEDAPMDEKAKKARKEAAEKYVYCEFDNCYELLGVSPTSGPIPIKRAYRKLAAEWHPDRCPSGDVEKCKEVFPKYANAYEILSSSEMRKNYDYVLANPQEFPGFFLKYSKPIYAPKSDLRFVLLLTILIAGGVQHMIKSSMYDQALAAMKSDPRARYNERLKEVMARMDKAPPSPTKKSSGAARQDSGSSKHNKTGGKSDELDKKKKAAEEQLATELAAELPPRPSLADNLAVSAFKAPLTLTYTFLWALKGGMGEPAYKTRKALAMSEAEWEALDEAEAEELLGKELWLSENLEAWEAEISAAGKGGAKSAKEKREQRLRKKAKANPATMQLDD